MFNTCYYYFQMDVIIADLDGGSIRVPESLTLSLLPEPFWTDTHNALTMVIIHLYNYKYYAVIIVKFFFFANNVLLGAFQLY